MYRPGTEPPYRPRGAVPPPPPPGMMHYVPVRQIPPPIHGRPYSTPQFSYASGPPPPPTTSQVRPFASSGPPLQPPPPGIHVPPFVPPLPSDLPPPPPLSPPPSPPPLPSETLLVSDLQPQHVAQDRRREDASSASLSEIKGHSENNDLQQKCSLPHLQSEAKNEPIRHVNSKNDLAQPQQHSDWNATYQDTLDEEAGSPATSDMDMDMEDADHLDGSNFKVSLDAGVNSAPSRNPRYPEDSRENAHPHFSGSSNTPKSPHSTGVPYASGTKQMQMNILHGARYALGGEDHMKMVSRASATSVKDHQNSGLKQEGQTVEGFSLVHTVSHALDEGSLACPVTEQASSVPKECRTARLSRWGSPPPLQPVQAVNESQGNDEYHLLAGSRQKLEHVDRGGDAINTSRNIQGPNIAARTNGDIFMDTSVTVGGTVDISRDLERPISTNPTGDRSLMTDTVLDSTQQLEHKKDLTVDEFGRLVHKAASDSEPEGAECHLPVDEFGRVVQRGASGSESEGDRRPSKRKRSYTRSRSRSRSRRSRSRSSSRSRSRSRSRGRSGSRSRSSSRSRSRSSSRSPTRSSGETRRRRQSFSRSPRRKMRWSRSRSRSPQWRRSYSRTPPRDMRWGGLGRGERDWRGDREYFGRGRRGGRGSGPNPCFHYARGRCFRGNSCRYLHVNRETMVQDRGTWRRDIQTERHLDVVREDYTGDQHNRGAWRRDPWTERREDFGVGHQEYMVDTKKKDSILSSNMSQEDAGKEPSSNRLAINSSKREFWTPRSALEAEDMQVMAYNKALELVGIPHIPSERVVGEESVIENEAQVDEQKSEYREVSKQEAMLEVSSVVTSEAPREVALLESTDARREIPIVESSVGIGLVDSSHKESAVEANDKVREMEFAKLNVIKEETENSEKLDTNEHEAGRILESAEDAMVIGGMEVVFGEADAREVSELNPSRHGELPGTLDLGNVLEGNEKTEVIGTLDMDGDMEAVEDRSNIVTEKSINRRQESSVFEEQELRSEMGTTGNEVGGHDLLVLEKFGELNAAAELEPLREVEVSKNDADLEGKVLEHVSRVEVLEKPEARKDSASCEATVTCSEVGAQTSLESEAIGNVSMQSVKQLEDKDGFQKSDAGSEVDFSVPMEHEPNATAAKAATAEMSVRRVDSVPPLLPQTPQGQQHALIGQPGSVPPILPPPSQGQLQICTGHPVTVPGLLPPPPLAQAHLSSDQPHAHQYPPSSMQHPTFAGSLPRATQYSSYRPRSLIAPQPLDQASRPRAKFNSGHTGYPPAGGWGQQGFHPRAPTQDVAPVSQQVHGPPNYGTSFRQSHGPSISGAPFYGQPNHGDKLPHYQGPPYPGDQFLQHHRPPNPGDQIPQHQRPINSAGFGPPNPAGPFSQHHGSSNSGAPFSQQHVAPSPSGPLPPPQNYRPSSHGPPFLSQPASQNYGQPNQPAYSASFPAQHGNQNSVPTQQPGHSSQILNPSANPPFNQLQLASTQGFCSNSNFFPEQPQSSHAFAGSTGNQIMQPNVLNVGFSPNSVFSSSAPLAQSSAPWNFQGSQRPVLPPTGQSSSYSYPLTTIPPLSGLVQVPQATNPPIQNDQYDPLSDVLGSGLAGASLVRPPAASSQDINTGKVESRPETLETDTKVANEDVGVVENISPENWSPGQPADETEAGQEQALSKKSSRGLKMLRSAIADHVKEVLKPTWREGYMSKEAFKTIAKKAVEKVVGNLPSHHIPKSQEKVDQFMKASRPKISKLVQGYVDKYLKL